MGYLDGFGVTLKKYVGSQTESGRRITLEYPEETRPKPERFHGRHVLNRYEDGMEKCIGCELCAGVCPADCIYVRGKDNDPDDPTSPGERYGFVYEINYLRCIHCDLCVEACPTEAITETKLFEFSFTNRADAIYTRDELLVDDEGRPQQLPWENWSGGFDPAEQSSGWMRATAPSGDAAFVDVVAWAGELGYGVRAPSGGGIVEPAPGPEPVVARKDGRFDLDGPPDDASPVTSPVAPAAPVAPAPSAPAAFDAPAEARVEPAEAPAVDRAEPVEEPGDVADEPHAGYFDAPEEPEEPRRRGRFGRGPR